jgi:phosphoenolpyruvate carboxylase
MNKPPSSPAKEPRPLAKMKADERPLVEDIRLLGRILGDVIREQEGQDAYDQIEIPKPTRR